MKYGAYFIVFQCFLAGHSCLYAGMGGLGFLNHRPQSNEGPPCLQKTAVRCPGYDDGNKEALIRLPEIAGQVLVLAFAMEERRPGRLEDGLAIEVALHPFERGNERAEVERFVAAGALLGFILIQKARK